MTDGIRAAEDPHFSGGVTQKAVLFRPDGDVLLVRDEAGASDREFPGGRVENHETAEEGLHRELRMSYDELERAVTRAAEDRRRKA